MNPIKDALECYWASKRLQRYLDSDPDGQLSPDEIKRLETHVRVCDRCSKVAGQHRTLRSALSKWALSSAPSQDSIDSLTAFLGELETGEKST